MAGGETAEVDEDASLLIVNSGLALPESPNTGMDGEHGVFNSSARTTYGR